MRYADSVKGTIHLAHLNIFSLITDVHGPDGDTVKISKTVVTVYEIQEER
jgi:hypothetical protein